MNKKFFFSILIGFLLGFISIAFQSDYFLQILSLFANLLINIFLIIGPIITFFSLTSGIISINKDFKFFIKFFIIIISTLLIGGIIFYIICKILLPNLLTSQTEMPINSIKPLPLTGFFSNIYDAIVNIKKSITKCLPLFLLISIVLGIVTVFTNNITIKKFIDLGNSSLFVILKKFLLPIMPIWTISLFANLTYESALTGLIINDFVLSIVIFSFQILFLLCLYYLCSRISKLDFKKIFLAGKNIFIKSIEMMGLGGNLIIPYSVSEQEKLGIKTGYAQLIAASNFNLPGSFFSNIGFAYGIIVIYGLNISNLNFIIYILLLIITTIIAPAIPLGVFSITQQLLTPILGFNIEQVQLMSTFYYNQGTTNSAVNNSGDVYLGILTSKKSKD